jgi:TPR repeat protein
MSEPDESSELLGPDPEPLPTTAESVPVQPPPPTTRAPARRYSSGFVILVSTLTGIISLIIGLSVFILNHEYSTIRSEWQSEPSVQEDGSIDPSAHLEQGLAYYRSGEVDSATDQFALCRLRSKKCDYMLLEIGLGMGEVDAVSKLSSSASSGNADSQFLHATILSNKFFDTSNYTAETFPLSVLHMYAASTAGHAGSLMAMGYRHWKGYGVPKRCETAALNYLEVAKPVANIYANSIPRAVELVRLNVEKDKKLLSINEISLFLEVANTNMEISQAVGRRFLLGSDGFPQDYTQALKFLQTAAFSGNDTAAWALLGYMYALGLGVDADIPKAEEYFQRGIEDGLGKNGLGYLKFQNKEYPESFRLFNESALAGSSDGMFNLASLYLTGTGVIQNFQKAFMWFTEALRRGHTPACYALAVMHLNGIGTVRDCPIAVNLLKEVAERGDWVSRNLRTAYAFMANGQTELAAVILAKLAEAGHQVSQENLAHLIESGQVNNLFSMNSQPVEFRKIYAQRYFELASEQGSAVSELKLADYAYFGMGLKADLEEETNDTVHVAHFERKEDFIEAFDRYKKAGEMIHKITSLTGKQTPQWLAKLEGTAEFNLGFMYHMGLGVRQNFVLAANHYRRSIPVESHGRQIFLELINWLVHPGEPETASEEEQEESQEPESDEPSLFSWLKNLTKDPRILILLVLVVLLLILFIIR